ncbi:MAG: hypothetical protein NCW75_03245 [Phycisphaera sp.]|nr:MAG: hypothetical protein NCW75_03245 [Phycisphaera sp.]
MRGREHRPAILLPVLVFLSLGLVCAYASSVVTVLIPDRGQFTPRTSSRHDLDGDQSIYVFTVRRPGYSLMAVTGPIESYAADMLDEQRSQPIPLRPGDPRPGWLRRSSIENPQNSRGIAAGWPFLCVWGRTDTNVNHELRSVHTGLSHVTVRKARRAFPWLPLLPGLIANTVIYASPMLMLWYAGVWAHRRWRRWRGRCPNCAYPMQNGVDPCPECGMPLQPTAAGSSIDSDTSSTSSRQTTSTLTSKSSSKDDK